MDFLGIIDLKAGDSGLLLCESPEKDRIQFFKQDCNGVNHKYEFAINEGYISLISYETTASTTTPELKQALNEATYN